MTTIKSKLFAILEDAYHTEIDYDVLGVAKDFLIDNNEIEKANCLDYLIKTKFVPLYEREYFHGYISSEEIRNSHYLYKKHFTFCNAFNKAVFFKSFPEFIWGLCLIWELQNNYEQRDPF